MRKSFFVGLLVVSLLLIPQVALGLNSPEVQARGGETTLMFIGDKGLQLDTEYGITSEVGLCVAIRKDATKVGAKYEFDSNLALLLGVIEQAPFIGANIAMPLDQYMGFVGDLSLSLASNRLAAVLELGMVLALADNLDLRGGLLAETDQYGKNFSFQIGLGVNY
ncbi:MAG TPA: hypothetical protein GXX33_02625 [Firmicutes bacterium]|uniref:Uncharacterized protein n=1 Tax=Capillibacterium thermochitinicola TaxID=2699427 RepID=A0A8J6HY77_9FIRM|nr:hypothetical protein [Capillibacterium thermochitinicola]MBA2133722.1 hypothetical protein [Capillibacterium thermochitinicola]HHW11886.1 hypothetical protein [Bacillota bacterium]